jgi:alpha-aminoadipate carrier protein LysW
MCPECEADVYVETDADKGDKLACDECGTELEIVGLDPIELDIVEEDDEEEEDEEEEF